MDPDIQITHWVFNKAPKRKSRPEIISLDSDSDIEIVDERPSKRRVTNATEKQRANRKSKSNDANSARAVIEIEIKEEEPAYQETESDYENIPGYEMSWHLCPPPENVENAQDITAELEDAIKRLHLGRTQLRSNPGVQPSRGKIEPSISTYRGIRGFGPVSSSYHGNRSRVGLLRYRGKEFETPLKHLNSECIFRMADACTYVCQVGDRILVSSGTPGGGENDPERSLYNESNTLAYVQGESKLPEFLPSHYLRGNDPGGDGSPDAKYYDVERACLDPNEPNVFVSSGRDGVLTIWNYATMKIKNLYSNSGEAKLSYLPVRRWGRETFSGNFVHDIVYRKNKTNGGKSIFSAPCRGGNLYIHSYSYDGDQSHDYHQQMLSNKQSQAMALSASIGATLWGEHASSGELFTCTEVKRSSWGGISHHVFDLYSGKSSYTLDRRQNGEEICLNPEGSTLALFTQRSSIIDLDLYDVRRKDGHSIANVRDIPCDDEDPTITKAAWSPDGILLAVAVNDHRIHVYDGRFLKSNKPVMEFYHDVQLQRSFSVTFMEWTTESFRGQNIGLVTGNSGDNRILLWDTRYANRDPTVLAEICSQVSVGCLGDPSKREKPLIVGGLDGWVHAYDTSGRAF